MDEIVSRLSSYNIVNYLFPGILFAVFADALTLYSFHQDSIVVSLFVYYFIGLVISRFGSLVVEPLLQKSRFLTFAAYRDYVAACAVDELIADLSEVNNMYRTLCAHFIALAGLLVFDRFAKSTPFLFTAAPYLVAGGFLLVFLFSYRKQTKYIVERIDIVKENE